MRITLEIDDDVPQAARAIAAADGITTGKALSILARRGLAPNLSNVRLRNGVPLLPRTPGGRPLTMRDVNDAREDE
jgi:antitoxin component of RelBE/YafQ-DinJ toxin-antitoxin module